MSKLNATDIQGFVLRGYNLPVARYLFLRLEDAKRGRDLIRRLLSEITTGQRWEGGKPGTKLQAIPYHVEYKKLLEPAAKSLREAADLSDDKDFAEFLRMRADEKQRQDAHSAQVARSRSELPVEDPELAAVAHVQAVQ